jgi:hypothetical protein
MCIPLSLLGNGSVRSPNVARQRLDKNRLLVARQRLGKNSPNVARQRLGTNVTVVTNTRKNRRIVGCVVFNVAFLVSRKVGD